MKLFLQETTTAGASSLFVGDAGLFNVGAQVGRTSGAATITGISYNTADFGGGGNNSALGGGSVNFQEGASVSSSSGPTGTVVSPGVRQELLATLTVTAGAVGNVSNFTLANHSGSGNTITYTNGFDLDVNGTNRTANDGNTYSWAGASGNVSPFTVTATPEPVGAAVFAAGALLLSRRRRRPA